MKIMRIALGKMNKKNLKKNDRTRRILKANIKRFSCKNSYGRAFRK